MLIKAAINGGRSKAEHPYVPVTPEEQASATLECLEAGAQAIHLHVRDGSGAESLDGNDVARTLQAVRSLAPKAPVGISTGAWIVPDTAERFTMAAAWNNLPDFVSVNFSEQGARELAQLLHLKGVGIEAGLSDEDAARAFVDSKIATTCIRVLLEPQEQETEKALDTVNQMELVLDKAQVLIPRVLHGTEATTWPILKEALNRGYGIRIGFEDTFELDNGLRAQSNAQLISAAVKLTIKS